MPSAQASGRHGAVIILSGPSGVGKTTVYRQFLNTHPNVHFAVSCTTRPAREGEINGTDYCFITRDDFEKRIRHDEFLEYATVHGNLYGTPRQQVETHIRQGRDVLLDVDVQGARLLRKALNGTAIETDALFVFCGPPAFSVLEKRLRHRKKDSAEVIAERVQNAREELKAWREYDYLIINDTVDEAVSDLAAVVRAFRCRTSRIEEELWNDG